MCHFVKKKKKNHQTEKFKQEKKDHPKIFSPELTIGSLALNHL
jgi:hypothetical protein